MKRLLIPLALALAASAQAQNAVQQQQANWTHQQNMQYFHHILPEQQRVAAEAAAAANAAAAARAQRRAEGVYYIVGEYYRHTGRFSAFAIGSAPQDDRRNADGLLMKRTQVKSGGNSYNRGAESQALAHQEALKDCGLPSCAVIAEAGNTCMAVARGEADTRHGNVDANVAQYGVWGRIYTRFYVAQLSPAERGDPQSDVSDAQIAAWQAQLRERARAMCESDRAHPLHECQKLEDIWANCPIDTIMLQNRYGYSGVPEKWHRQPVEQSPLFNGLWEKSYAIFGGSGDKEAV